MHHSIGVNQCLASRGLQVDAYCPRCHVEAESILHMLCDCPVSKNVWLHLGRQVAKHNFFSLSLQDWLISNATSNSYYHLGPLPWSLIFLFGIWLIWKDRNICIFNQKNPNPRLGKEVVDCAVEFFYCANNGLVTKRTIIRSVRWEKLMAGWLTLNTDGSATGNSSLAGGGGLIRDENGDWVTGFARRIGSTNSFLAELWALRDGLHLCLQANAHSVIIEVDAKAIMDAFNSPTSYDAFVSPIMEDCRLMANRIPQRRFRYIYREANKSADFLARLGLLLDTEFVVFSSPPVDLSSLLEADAIGLFVNRLCPAPAVAV